MIKKLITSFLFLVTLSSVSMARLLLEKQKIQNKIENQNFLTNLRACLKTQGS